MRRRETDVGDREAREQRASQVRRKASSHDCEGPACEVCRAYREEREQGPPWTITRTTFNRRPAELMTFTGTTETEYDAFLDARFAADRDPAGFRRDAGAPHAFLIDESGGKGIRLHPLQFRRYIVEASGPQAPAWPTS